jgi:hypothetical protein
MKKRVIKQEPQRKLQKETYLPVEEWRESPSRFTSLPLNDGEYTVIVDPHTGMGLYLVARLRNTFRYHHYLDGVQFKGELKKVTMIELQKRTKEKEKFL